MLTRNTSQTQIFYFHITKCLFLVCIQGHKTNGVKVKLHFITAPPSSASSHQHHHGASFLKANKKFDRVGSQAKHSYYKAVCVLNIWCRSTNRIKNVLHASKFMLYLNNNDVNLKIYFSKVLIIYQSKQNINILKIDWACVKLGQL